MKLNCKPGDLAYVIDSEKPSHIGMVVRVVRPDPVWSGDPSWVVSFSGVVIGNGGEVLVGEGTCWDSSLRPIGGVPVDEETHDEVAA
jgi:hypothetical protein